MRNRVVLAMCLTWSMLAATESYDGVMIGTLKSNEYLIELWRIGSESKYLVKELDGQAVTEKVSIETLAQRFPELAESVESGMADDASVSPHLLEPNRSPVLSLSE